MSIVVEKIRISWTGVDKKKSLFTQSEGYQGFSKQQFLKLGSANSPVKRAIQPLAQKPGAKMYLSGMRELPQ